MYRLIYTTGVALYTGAIYTASLWNQKAKQWVQGRKHNLERINKKLDSTKPVIWMHCASLGEFEQGRPIIEALKERYPAYQILLTFFSPSGYEIRKNYEKADAVAYLPPDFPGQANRFVELVQPALVIFIKYEFWLNHLTALAKGGIPHILVAGRFDPHQSFFKWYGKGFRQALQQFSHIFVQDQQSAMLLKNQGIERMTVAGDPRFDRVMTIKNQAKSIPEIAAFVGDHPVLVAGSTWPADEALLAEWIKNSSSQGWKLIIVPHEIDMAHMQQIKDRFSHASLYSEQLRPDDDVAIIDTIGLLSSLYRYGDIAYVGGGFGKSIHNVLEAAVYGIPVVTGPAIKGVREAVQLSQKGGLRIAQNQKQGIEILVRLATSETERKQAGQVACTFVEQNQGATEQVMNWIEDLLKS